MGLRDLLLRPLHMKKRYFDARGPVIIETDADGNPKTFGLGDAVAALANPIARALDATLGTKIVGCGGCAQRQAALNKLLPNLGKVNKSDEQ